MSNASPSLLVPRAFGLALAVVMPIAAPASVSAQFASAIDLSSRTSQPTRDVWTSQLAISPFIRFDHPRVSVDARWTAFGSDGQRLDGVGNIDATYFSPSRAGFSFSASGFADRTRLNETFAASRIGTDARLSYRAGQNGAWIGREISRDNKSTPVSPVPHFSTGAWRQLGNAIVTVSLSSFGTREGARRASVRQEVRPILTGPLAPIDSQRNFRSFDTITVVDSGNGGRRHDWRDAELGVHWSAWRLAFQGVVGTRFSATTQPNETWGRDQGALTLAPDMALIAASGVHPSSAAYGVSRSRFVELGFRVSPSALHRPRLPVGVRPRAAAFEVDDAAHGARTLRVRIPDARTVELSGDFTNWKPIALARAATDRWEATLLIPPGLHRVAIRVDGDTWAPPPGVSSVKDEFQGTVGVIVVK